MIDGFKKRVHVFLKSTVTLYRVPLRWTLCAKKMPVCLSFCTKGDCSRFVTNPEHFDIGFTLPFTHRLWTWKKSLRLVRCREFLNLESEVNFLFSNECSFHDSIIYNNLIIWLFFIISGFHKTGHVWIPRKTWSMYNSSSALFGTLTNKGGQFKSVIVWWLTVIFRSRHVKHVELLTVAQCRSQF